MEKLAPKKKKLKGASREELLQLSKEELADRLIQLEAHNSQLKNIISKNLSDISAIDGEVHKNQKNFDFSKHNFRPILLHIMYFGWDYQGFVVQEDTTQTIEHHLFKALTKTCLIENRETAKYHRCGRTDKGVSAFGQVISLNIRSRYAPDKQNTAESISTELSYCTTLNRLLPTHIRAVGWMPVTEDISARFDCNRRQYKYYFPRSSLSIPEMRHACTFLVGSHDFRNLCKMDVGNGVTEFIRQILKADIVAVDENDTEKPTSMFYLLIEGNAFLWHQIRCIQAILLLVGSGYESPDIVRKLLDPEMHDRKPQYNMATDLPLNLFECNYDIKSATKWEYDEQTLGRLIVELQGEWTKTNIQATMIKDCLHSIEEKYAKVIEEKTDATEKENNQIVAYHHCLTEGVKPKIYTPLLKRPTCSTLEEKIEHYNKRRKQYKTDKPMVVEQNINNK